MFALTLAALLLVQTPLPKTHSHNDYSREHPLFDALNAGFCSVEADVFLVDGELRVAHNLKDTKPVKTLRSMYLEPLSQRVKENHGRVYKDGPEVWLLIDVKRDGEKTWQAIKKELRAYRFMMATTDKPGALRAVISGDRAIESIVNDREHLAGLDGRFTDLPSKYSFTQMPMVSDDWLQYFKFRGEPLTELERTKLVNLVRRVHQEGRRVRFWGVPDVPTYWQETLDAGIDFVNTDHPAKVAAWFADKTK
jgi:glycerophosphoryl diester phosphodiesterase